MSEENKKQLFIPRGFAHGFVVLTKNAIFSYKVDNYYDLNSDRGIAYDDPNLEINWKLNVGDLKISEKDSKHPLLSFI